MRTASTDTPDSDIQDKDEKIRERDRNFRLAMLQGTFMRMSFALVDAATILPAFVHTLTQSKVLVGLTGLAAARRLDVAATPDVESS